MERRKDGRIPWSRRERRHREVLELEERRLRLEAECSEVARPTRERRLLCACGKVCAGAGVRARAEDNELLDDREVVPTRLV